MRFELANLVDPSVLANMDSSVFMCVCMWLTSLLFVVFRVFRMLTARVEDGAASARKRAA